MTLDELAARAAFAVLKPSPRADTLEMLTIARLRDGSIVFAPGTDEPVRLAAFLRELLAVLVERPSIIEQASGIAGAAYHLLGPLHRIADIPEDDG